MTPQKRSGSEGSEAFCPRNHLLQQGRQYWQVRQPTTGFGLGVPHADDPGTYPQTKQIEGGYAILELPSRKAAFEWAAKIAAACRCAQEVRAFMYDPAS